MNTEIHNAFINALLADASYVEGLQSGDVGKALSDRLADSKRFPDSLATYIGDHFKVVTQYTDASLTSSGFSVTVFEDRDSGQRYISMRGTELSDAVYDFPTDIDVEFFSGLAQSQVRAMVNWYERATTPDGQPVTQISPIYSADYGVTGDGTLLVNGAQYAGQYIINGHSLGGHLTTVFARLFGQDFGASNTYNGLGVGGVLQARLATEVLLGRIETLLGLGSTTWPSPAEQNNYWAEHGINGATLDGWLQQYGTRIPLFNEEGTNPITNHLLYKLTDSLALADVMGMMDNSLTLAGIDTLFNAASNTPSNSLESILDGLRKLLLNQTNKTAVGDVEGNASSRTDFQQNLTALRDYVAVAGDNRFQIISLTNKPRDQIVALAQQNDASGLACRYALKELNPFAIVGADYSQFNANGELDLYAITGQGLTDLWLADRAAMLSWAVKANTEDFSEFESLRTLDPGKPDSYFYDVDSNTVIHLGDFLTGNDNRTQYLFGSDSATQGDTLTGGNKNDRIYGGGGDDTLTGGKGGDRLEGGSGFDTYTIAAGDSSVGSGIDTILDVDGSGRVILQNTDLANVGTQYRSKNVWVSAAGHFVYELLDQTDGSKILKITGDQGDTIFIKNFTNGALGIQLSAAPAVPVVNYIRNITGDLAPVDFDTTTPGVQTHLDALGNVIVTATQEANRADTINGGGGNDKLYGMGGDDTLSDSQGGDDRMEGGSGSDYLIAYLGQDTLIGGDGQDIQEGGSDDDHLYAQNEIDTDLALEQNATQVASNLKGDFMSGGDGNDTLIGDAGEDLLLGGSDDDILIGGGGDDTFYGDEQGSYAYRDWSITRQITTDGIYRTSFTSAGIQTAATGGNDVLYGQSGNDWLLGGANTDYLDGGADNDALFGQAGNDTIIGGGGQDTLSGGDDADTLWGDGVDGQVAEGDVVADGGDFLRGEGGNDKLYGGTDGARRGLEWCCRDAANDGLWQRSA